MEAMVKLNFEQMAMVVGGKGDYNTYVRQVEELVEAVLNNRILRYHYNQLMAEDDDLCAEDVLPELLGEYCSIKVDFVDYQVLYWDGRGNHEEVLRLVRRAYGGTPR